MSDFDKQKSPGNSEKKKLAVVGVLAAVLLGIGAVHFLKPSPQAASGAVVSSDPIAVAMPDETPAQAVAALQEDPTAKLLRGSQEDHTFDTVPHDPFRMAPEWEALLVKADDAPAVAPTHTDSPAPVVSAKAVDVSAFKLTGILHQGSHLYAIINGDIYTAGMTIDNAKIVAIDGDRVTFQRADAPSGPKATLSIDAKLK